MGKLFNYILNEIIIYHLEENNYLSDSQNGFRNGCRTSDKLFMLNNNNNNKNIYIAPL
jgi:hypothetical protein